MNHWGHLLAVAAVVLALGALLVAHHHAHQRTAADLYSSYISAHWAADAGQNVPGDTSTLFATEEQQAILRDAARDGMCHARSLNFETNVWGAIFVVFLIFLLFYHAYSQKYAF